MNFDGSVRLVGLVNFDGPVRLVGLVNFDGPVGLVGLVKISWKRTRLGDLFDHESYFDKFFKTI